MADHNPTCEQASKSPPNAGDLRDRSAILAHILDLHPVLLSFEELVREIVGTSPDFSERDQIERAIRDLIATGLLHRSGDLVLPTRAAVHFHELGQL